MKGAWSPALTLFAFCLSVSGHASNDGSVVVEAKPPTFDQVTDSFRVEVVIRNESDSVVSIEMVQLLVPDDFIAGGRKSRYEETVVGPDMEQNETRVIEFQVPAVNWRNTGTYFFRAKPRQIVVRVKYVDQQGQQIKRAPLTVDPLGSLWAVIIGGFGGVLLIVFYRYVRAMLKRTTAYQSGFHPVMLVVFGFLTVLIAVFVFRFSSAEATGLPLAVSVRDFYGGIILGVIFEPLSIWVSGLAGAAQVRSKVTPEKQGG